jgi:hypothetical protein
MARRDDEADLLRSIRTVLLMLLPVAMLLLLAMVIGIIVVCIQCDRLAGLLQPHRW